MTITPCDFSAFFLLPVLVVRSLTVGRPEVRLRRHGVHPAALAGVLRSPKELNSLASGWLDEIEEKYDAANQLETAYRAERVLLTSEMRRKREDEIASKRTEATDMQKAKFGVEASSSRSVKS